MECILLSLLTVAAVAESPDDRSANAALLVFQEALHQQRWDDALTMCSKRLNKAAEAFLSAENFFRQTTPLEKLINTRFGYWREGPGEHPGSTAYGMMVNLRPQPRLGDAGGRRVWYWSVTGQPNRAWLFDWEPLDPEAAIRQRQRLRKEYEARMTQIRREMLPKFRGVKFHLSTDRDSYAVGEAVNVRLELINFGTATVYYVSQFNALLNLKKTARHDVEPHPAQASTLSDHPGDSPSPIRDGLPSIEVSCYDSDDADYGDKPIPLRRLDEPPPGGFFEVERAQFGMGNRRSEGRLEGNGSILIGTGELTGIFPMKRPGFYRIQYKHKRNGWGEVILGDVAPENQPFRRRSWISGASDRFIPIEASFPSNILEIEIREP